MNGCELSSESFRDALNDYFHLLNRGYPEKPSLKLVGDRHRLTGAQRLCLLRGISSRSRALRRKEKQTEKLNDRNLCIDGYNVIFTVMNYLLGRPLFIGNDGFVRDCGAVYGKIEDDRVFSRAFRILSGTLSGLRLREATFYMDSTIKNCRDHLRIMEGAGNSTDVPLNLRLLKHADNELKKIGNGVVATSDSEIIDACAGRVVDLARVSLVRAFKTEFTDLNLILTGKPSR